MPSERQLTVDAACREIAGLRIARRIDKIIVHHTWKPTAADYRGLSTVEGIRRYHMDIRGWGDAGYHIEIGPNSDIWLCRPMERSGAHCRGHNAHSIGVSYIADFDAQDPATYAGLAAGQLVVAALCERFCLDSEDVFFHSDVSSKTCPGTLMDRAEYRQAVKRFMGSKWEVWRLPGSIPIECNVAVENGVARADVRALCEGLGFEVEPVEQKIMISKRKGGDTDD